MIELPTPAVAVYDVWGRRLFGGFENKTEAALWLLNHVPWKLMAPDPMFGGLRELKRVPTEFEADLYMRQDASLTKERCDPKEYDVYMDLHPLAHESENS
jgi:hypothetical protein